MSVVRPKVFVLGDSRTGTSSLNAFLNAIGIPSKHYYVKEASQCSPDHEHRQGNLDNLLSYIKNSGYSGFTDYPTRLYYQELHNAFPDAYFILSVRSSTQKWLRSMKAYFPKFGINFDEEAVTRNYEEINKKIIDFFKDNNRFLVVDIDEDDKVNSLKIKHFLGVISDITIGRENTSDDVDIQNVSRRKTLFKSDDEDWIRYVEDSCKPSKTLLSEKGWLYLINDTNDFYSWCYGRKKWTENERKAVVNIFKERVQKLEATGRKYIKIITPEKNIVYPEYLPHIFDNKRLIEDRPATLCAKASPNVHYLDKYLISLKGFARSYFKGDSHINWHGAYFIYRYMIAELSKMGFNLGPAIELSDLEVSLANYKGDLYNQALDAQLTDIHGVWGPFNLSDSLGYEINLQPKAQFSRINSPSDYVERFGQTRDVITTTLDKKLPTAIVFRDSTCDFLVPFISNHFSKVTYIWHKGDVYEDVIERENPDVVINMMAERFLSNYHQRNPFC
tara:strand:+ start:8719 stop:10230 length:1512 start_codon:yes stop_codon:yes gene_type:complete